jgi:hypothetical protein
MRLYARLWTDILGDPKLMKAARHGARNLELTPWLFAFAKRADADGRLEIAGEKAEAEDIASEIPCATSTRVASCIESLRKLKILKADPDGVLSFTAWEFRNSGKTSDSREAVAERVRKHRERKKGESNADGNAGNALPSVTGNEQESREKRVERREKKGESKKAGSSSGGSLGPNARDFGRMFYSAAPAARRQDVYRQLMATLNGGARLRRGVIVTAGSVERLELKCREVIQEGVDDPDKAIVVLLTKLADSTDIAAQRREEVREEIVESDRIGDERRAAAAAFAVAHPDRRHELEERALREFPGDGPFHDLTRESWVVQQLATLAGAEPMDPQTTDGAHEPF